MRTIGQGASDAQADGLALDPENFSRLGNEDDLGGESRSDTGVDPGDEEKAVEEQRAQNFGGPFKLPLVALGMVSKFATGLLGLRGNGRKDAEVVVENKASSSHCRTKRAKQGGLEELLDGDAAAEPSGEQMPPSPTKWHRNEIFRNEIQDFSEMDTLQVLADSVLMSMGSDVQGQDRSPSSTPMDTESDEREPTPSDSSKRSDDQDQEHFADAFPSVRASAEGEKLPEMGNMTGAIKHFDSVMDPTDHHYERETGQVNALFCPSLSSVAYCCCS